MLQDGLIDYMKINNSQHKSRRKVEILGLNEIL